MMAKIQAVIHLMVIGMHFDHLLFPWEGDVDFVVALLLVSTLEY